MKVLVVGAGVWGSKLIKTFDSLVGAENVLVCDLDEEKRLAHAETHLVFPSHLEAMQEADAVVVATLPATHFELAWHALAQGKPVLVEKPMALEAKHASQLMRFAEEQRVTLMCDDTWRYHEYAQRLLFKGPQVKSEFHWVGPREGTPPEGILWTMGPHPISLMLQSWGGTLPDVVEGAVRPRCAMLHYEAEYGIADIFLDWETKHKVRRFFQVTKNLDGQRSYTYFNDSPSLPQRSPLERMCEAFLSRVGHCWVDHHSEKVVGVLEWTQQQLSTSR